MINWSSQQERAQIINEIRGPENKQRKAESFKQYEIFNDRQTDYVYEFLEGINSSQTVQNMPVISSINLARRIIKQEASIYRQAPKRKFYNVSEDQEIALHYLYRKCGYNEVFQSSNEYFKLQNQNILQVVLSEGWLKLRRLLPHQLDAVPKDNNPEKAQSYIINTFDRREFQRFYNYNNNRPVGVGTWSSYGGVAPDLVNQKIGDPDDYRAKLDKYVVWSNDANFIMNRTGEILSEDIENPIGVLPFIDISRGKDFEFWVRQGYSVTDFSVQFNGLLSDVGNVVRMQGFGQAVMIGDPELMPESLQIGPTFVLRLPVREGSGVTTDFKFVTANADIGGSLEFIKSNLSMFLSSRGINPGSVSFDGSSSEKFSSGLDRLLSMITKFEASKSDMDLYREAEEDVFEVVKAYLNTYQGSEFLAPELQIGQIPEDATMEVEFAEPQMVMTEQEKLDLLQKKKELGLVSDVGAYMDYYNVDEETAIKEIAEINESLSRVNTMLGVNG